MKFFLTEKYDTPKPSRLFWMCHWLGWGSLGLVNTLFSIIVGASIYLGVFSFLVLVSVNTIACLKLRELIYGKELLSRPFNKIWGKLSFYSISLALISSVCIRSLVGVYQYLWPQENIQQLDVNALTAYLLSWLSLSIWIFIWGLIYVSVKYSNQLKEAQRTSAELALELRNAQLNTLAAQLNPHFLFNALNNIRGLMLEDVEKSREMLSRLSEMMRYSLLSDKKEYESLENELGVVRAYLKLASIQYEERLQYIEEIDTGLLNCQIPPMIVQMLIENAVKYGIDQTTSGGEIKLSILPIDDTIIMQVSNPGMLQNNNPESTGLGVKNIQKRLQLLYGDAASFSIKQVEERVIVTVTLPRTAQDSAKALPA